MQLNDWIGLVRRRPPGWSPDADRALHRLESSGGHSRPGWSRFRQLVAESDMEDIRQRTVLVDSARDLQALSPYMTRTLRSEVDEHRPIREAATRIVAFSTEEEAFYNEVYRICLERALAQGVPPGFATQMPEAKDR